MPLNESPSEKEGKCREAERTMGEVFGPSMKVPPKRKGNSSGLAAVLLTDTTLNESPSEKEGKYAMTRQSARKTVTLNESPSEKEGKLPLKPEVSENTMIPSMKVPPKRKGNLLQS